ncbi:2,5-diketo-D-gluconic acid reductase A, putative [Perkinsus marinus ATCC 50983]|uniref:2,5-diketo-D-gluconic acid reductase A, putative n=1 Tax=Perkinsus marinus (strain ATCC 50983 / TXsc) TaxID=423536 RepID=C5KK53_PERM5|nr:2,5-diketo-D-gluconic acid reductase A, putative [Perkinsus marinus ATCC 50983]EER14965.1 2,5-diketo-D-gluconic acid reductase A, putative [Perkinsus marinus ATCC 50983]|eukprot:XP_002783169.1 2,5-diketo-D-gluconic acid reductase A, putative [Perkinsus marinus ATCC 50983]
MRIPTKVLSSGNSIPMVGLGTFRIGIAPKSAFEGVPLGRDGKAVIKDAIEEGYRLFDCAQFYLNEAVVGDAIAESGIPRQEFFIISKVWPDKIFKGRQAVIDQCKQSLKDLRTSYVDLYLIHFPVPGKHVEAYHALEELYKEGLCHSIGLSNYTIEDYEELIQAGISIPPSCNEIEVNPLLFRKKTIEYFQSKDIPILSWRGLGNGRPEMLEHPVLTKIAADKKVTTAQVIGRWLVQHSIVHIPKSENPERMRVNKDIFSFELSSTQMAEIDAIGSTKEAVEAFRQHYKFNTTRDCGLTEADARQQFTCE